jgi:hypothetical protein
MENSINSALQNKYLGAVMLLLAATYGNQMSFKLPNWTSNVLQNSLFKILFLITLLTSTINLDLVSATIVALLFVLILSFFSENNEHLDVNFGNETGSKCSVLGIKTNSLCKSNKCLNNGTCGCSTDGDCKNGQFCNDGSCTCTANSSGCQCIDNLNCISPQSCQYDQQLKQNVCK